MDRSIENIREEPYANIGALRVFGVGISGIKFQHKVNEFYRKYGIPLPRENPASRMSDWRKQFGMTVNFYKRKCPSCGSEFETSYSPERPENVYCEACYLKEVV